MSLVTFAGFSRTAGVLKFRAASDAKRSEVLVKLGDTDVNLVALPNAMSKDEAKTYVLSILASFAVDTSEARLVLTDSAPKAPRAAKTTTKVVKSRTVKVTKSQADTGPIVVSGTGKDTTPELYAALHTWGNPKLRLKRIRAAMKKRDAMAVAE